MIPDAAVEAAAEWLPHSGDCEVRPERDCTCWQQRVDIMRAALEAAAPHMTPTDSKMRVSNPANAYDGRYVINPEHLADEFMLAGWAKKLMAEAWEEGKNVRRCDGVPPNPYRPTP